MEILLGYSDVGYRVLLNNKMIVASVDIVEENVKCIGLDEVESKYPFPSSSTLESSRGEEKYRDDFIDDNFFQSVDENDEQEQKVENKENLELLKIPRRSTREKKKTDKISREYVE